MFRIALKGILGRKARLILTSLAVILGTSFLAGTSVFSDTLNRTFDNLFSDVFKNVDAYVRSTQVIEADFGQEERQRISADLVSIVESVPGVRDASPDIQAFARIIGKDGKPIGSGGQGPPTFGSVGEEFAGALWSTAQGRWPVGSTEVVIDEASAKAGKYILGDSVKVVAQSGSREFTLVGIASYGDVRSPGGATFALFDSVTAAEFLTQPGFIDAILVSGDGSVSDAKLTQAIQDALPTTGKTETLTGAEITLETQDQIGSALDFFGILLKTFSFIALGVGCFVIYNVFSISAAQRQRENALLRAIGASRKQITRAMLIESIVVGLIGSIVGVVAGIGLSVSLTALLRALNIDLPSSGLVVSQNTVTSTIVIGLIVTVLSAILPARRAGKVPPLAAMRATALEIAEPGRKRLITGLLSIALGVAIIGAVVAGASNNYLGIGILFVFIGTIVLGPIIARPVALFLGRPAARFRGVTGTMARQNSARNPKRTSRTASPVLIGVALVTAVTALAASIKGQIDDVFTAQFKGDYAISTDARGFGGLSPSLAVDLNKLPQVEKATGFGFLTVKVDGRGQYVTTINPKTIEGLWDIGLINATYADLKTSDMFVSEKVAKRRNIAIGSVLQTTFGDGSTRPLTVAGIYVNNEIGDYIANSQLVDGSAIIMFDIGVYILTKENVDKAEAFAALDAAVKKYGQGELLTKQEYINKQSGQVNQLLGLIYGLLMLSVIISIVGIIITLLLSVFERQRELGLLRAVGMTRSQVRTTVRWESVITSFIVGLFAAIYPAWRATRVNILDALNTN